MAATKVSYNGNAEQITDFHGQIITISNGSNQRVRMASAGNTYLFTPQNVADLVAVLQGYISTGLIS